MELSFLDMVLQHDFFTLLEPHLSGSEAWILSSVCKQIELRFWQSLRSATPLSYHQCIDGSIRYLCSKTSK